MYLDVSGDVWSASMQYVAAMKTRGQRLYPD